MQTQDQLGCAAGPQPHHLRHERSGAAGWRKVAEERKIDGREKERENNKEKKRAGVQSIRTKERRIS